MIEKLRTHVGASYWIRPDMIGDIENPDGSYRKGPRMAAVYSNAYRLFKAILLLDAAVLLIWAACIAGIISEGGESALAVGVITCLVFGLISLFLAMITVMAVRSERLIMVIAYYQIDGRPIMGFHDDLPS